MKKEFFEQQKRNHQKCSICRHWRMYHDDEDGCTDEKSFWTGAHCDCEQFRE